MKAADISWSTGGLLSNGGPTVLSARRRTAHHEILGLLSWGGVGIACRAHELNLDHEVALTRSLWRPKCFLEEEHIRTGDRSNAIGNGTMPTLSRRTRRTGPRQARQLSPGVRCALDGGRTRRRSLEEQVERAARVQRSLLPDLSVPQGEFRFATIYRPCEALGGDFYDLVRFRHRATLMVADVMGHGIEAALTTMVLKVVFQETAVTICHPRKLLAEMNARLHALVPPKVFVAAGIASINLNSSELRFANAGLPHPFILRARPRRVEEVGLNGRPLGLFGDRRRASYEVSSLSLAPGDVFLIASDGLGSITTDEDEAFEDGRLRESLCRVAGHEGKEVIDGLMKEAARFCNGELPPDDINLVAITRMNRPRPASRRPGSLKLGTPAVAR